MVSAPPGRLSTTTCCPISLASSAPMMRATVSVALPAACGTMSLIGLSGYSAAALVANAQASSVKVNRSPRMSFSEDYGSAWTAELRRMERLQGVDRVDWLGVDVPLEESQH